MVPFDTKSRFGLVDSNWSGQIDVTQFERASIVGWLLLMFSLVLCGCSGTVVDMLGVRSPEGAPGQQQPRGYLPVNDLPRERDEALVPLADRIKMQADLVAARDRQAPAVLGALAPPAAAR
jgi:hypothetical protein